MQELQLIIPLCVGSEMVCLFHDKQEICRNQDDAKRLQVKHLTLFYVACGMRIQCRMQRTERDSGNSQLGWTSGDRKGKKLHMERPLPVLV